MIAPNIFQARNDWNVKSMACRKCFSDDMTFEKKVVDIVYSEIKIDPYNCTKYRGGEHVLARQLVSIMIHNYTGRSLKSIGNIFNKGHANVLHSIKAIKDRYETDKYFRAMYNRIDEKVKRLI